MMDFMAEQFGKQYAPNTRETVRRQSVHQFLAAGLIVQNPDDPNRPINSAKTTYQVVPAALELLSSYGGPHWEPQLARYRETVDALTERWERARAAADPDHLPGRHAGPRFLAWWSERPHRRPDRGLLSGFHTGWTRPLRRRR